MFTYKSTLILSLLAPMFIFSEESATIKVVPNRSTSHELNLSMRLDQDLEGKNSKVFSLNTETISDLSYVLFHEIPELKISQEKSSIDFQAGPLNIKYKLDENHGKDTFWGYFHNQVPDTILLPLVDKVDFLRQPNEKYSILPIENVQNYIEFVHFIKDLTDRGITFKKGDVYETKQGEKENFYWFKLKVKEITSKDVVLDLEGELRNEQQLDEVKKVISLGTILGEIKIDKTNLFLIQAKIESDIKAHTLPAAGEINILPIIQRGTFNGKISLELKSKDVPVK